MSTPQPLPPLGQGPSRPADLRDRVAVVTGAARGIGRAIAEALAQAGAKVALLDVMEPVEAVQALRARGTEAVGLVCDVTSRPAIENAMGQVVATFGRIDILVNNAGILERSSLEAMDEATFDRVIGVIVKGTLFCTQAVYETMKHQGGGKIVNVSSISAKLGGAASTNPAIYGGRSGPAYAAAKGGVVAFTKWIARDAGPHGIYVNAVCPGPVTTEMTKGYDYGVLSLPLAKMGDPADVAMTVLFLASQMSNHITGQSINIDGGLVMD
jgi:3-oxoacyl-[acyl-carrier protein] reductase